MKTWSRKSILSKLSVNGPSATNSYGESDSAVLSSLGERETRCDSEAICEVGFPRLPSDVLDRAVCDSSTPTFTIPPRAVDWRRRRIRTSSESSRRHCISRKAHCEHVAMPCLARNNRSHLIFRRWQKPDDTRSNPRFSAIRDYPKETPVKSVISARREGSGESAGLGVGIPRQ
mgnify:CR=1 FL=1